jgi:hypothetical protein
VIESEHTMGDLATFELTPDDIQVIQFKLLLAKDDTEEAVAALDAIQRSSHKCLQDTITV